MTTDTRVTQAHLRRTACIYVRQSTAMQLERNPESTDRQYGPRRRALELGWSDGQIAVIDDDLGKTGSGAVKAVRFRANGCRGSTGARRGDLGARGVQASAQQCRLVPAPRPLRHHGHVDWRWRWTPPPRTLQRSTRPWAQGNHVRGGAPYPSCPTRRRDQEQGGTR